VIRNLPHGGLINIFTSNAGVITAELIPEKYRGLDRFDGAQANRLRPRKARSA